MKIFLNLLFISSVVFLLAGCEGLPANETPIYVQTSLPVKQSTVTLQAETDTPVPSTTIIPSATLVPSATPFLALENTPQIIPILTPDWDGLGKVLASLEPGNYLYSIYWQANSTEIVFGAEDGDLVKHRLGGESILSFLAISPNNRYLAFHNPFQPNIYIYDLHAIGSEPRMISPPDLMCINPSWSPNNDYILATCWDENLAHKNVYLISIDGKRFSMLTDGCNQNGIECFWGNWSPDGSTIAFIMDFAGAGECEECGVYLIPTSCLTDPSSCMDLAKGVIDITWPISWSPDGKLLAGVSQFIDSLIRIYSADQMNLRIVKNINPQNLLGLIYSIAWSPNGEYLAIFTRRDGIELITISDGNSQNVQIPGELMGWIEIPPQEVSTPP